jgi:hypothetical protein
VSEAGDGQEPPKEPPDTSGSKPSAGSGRAIKAPKPEVYDRWWVLYRDGARSLKKLAKVAKISPSTAQHAINVGWPEAQLAPLKDRSVLHDQAQARAVQKEVARAQAALSADDQAAAIAAAKAAMSTWTDAARHALEGLTRTSVALAALAQKVDEASAEATFVRYRRVPQIDPQTGLVKTGRDGKPMMLEQAYVDAYRHAQATLLLVRASREHAHLVRSLLGDIKPMDPKTGEGGHIPGLLAGHTAVTLYMPSNGRENEDPEDEIREPPAGA